MSCSKGSSTSTEGQQKKPAFAAEERSVGDVDGGVPLVNGAKKPVKLAANRKITAEFKSRVTDALQRGRGYDLIVEIKSEATKAQKGLRQTASAAQAMKNARAAVVQGMGAGAQLKQEFGNLPFVMVHVSTLQAFNALMGQQDVAHIHENQELQPLANVDTVIGRTSAATTINYGGTGGLGSYNAAGTQTAVNIVVLDGKVDTSAPGLGGAGLVTISGSDSITSTHATALAGAIHAMAPSAHIYNEIITTSGVATTSSLLIGLGNVSTINGTNPISAVVIALGSNNSYANATDCAAGDGAAFTTLINSLRNTSGIVTFAAAGNAANTTSMPAPACLANVVSVGATQGPNTTSVDYLSTGSSTCVQSSSDKDARLCNSNASPDTDLLAPGFTYECSGGSAAGTACQMDSDCAGGTCKVLFHCDGLGTVQNSNPVTYVSSSTACTASNSCGLGGKCIPVSPYGTSIATANAAAAFAIVRGFGLGQSPAEGVERALARVTAGGQLLVDPRNDNSVPARIQLDAAIVDCVGPVPSVATVNLDLNGAPAKSVTVDTDPGCGAGTVCTAPVQGTTYNMGNTCAFDSQCKRADGFCDLRCLGGVNNNGACTSDANCLGSVGSCAAMTCAGGDFPGASCLGNGDCLGHAAGACDTGLTCTGGANPNGPCSSDTDCTGFAQACTLDVDGDPMHLHDTCADGISPCFDGSAGGDDSACPAPVDGFCQGTCSGGTNPGGACATASASSDCPGAAVSNGTCGGHCSGGSNAGAVCAAATAGTDCPTIADGTCNGGNNALCVGGDRTTLGCTTNSQCLGTGDCSGSIQMDGWITLSSFNNGARSVTISAQNNTAGERIGQVAFYNTSITVDQTGDTTAPGAGALTVTTPTPLNVSSKNWINTGTVTLTNTASGNPSEMCFQNVEDHCDLTSTAGSTGGPTCDKGNIGDDCAVDTDCLPSQCEGTWLTYATTKSGYALAAGSGDKTVEGWYRDTAGNVSSGALVTVTVDGTAPSNGAVTTALDTTNPLAPQVNVSVTNTTDSGVGIGATNNLKIAFAVGTTAPANCSSGSVVSGTHSGNNITYSITSGLTGGTTYSFRVCTVDSLGNVSTGVATPAIKIVTDNVVPAGALTLTGTGGFPGYSTNLSATGSITLSSSDDLVTPNSVSVCIAKAPLDGTATCPTTAETGGWQAVTSSSNFAPAAITLATGDGVKTYYYKFKDNNDDNGAAAGVSPNVSAIKTVTLKLDMTAPKAGTVSGTTLINYDAKVTWTGFSDTAFPIAQYKVYGSALNGAAPACGSGTLLYTGTATTFTDTGMSSAGTRSYTVCAIDGVNRQVFASVSGIIIRLEITAPVLGTTVVLPTCNTSTLCYGTAKYTKDTTPAIQVTVSDAHISGGSVCFASTNSTTGCSWQTVTGVAGTSSTALYSPTKALATGSTTQNYYLFAKDSLGNVSAAKVVPVKIDTVGPVFTTVALTKASTTSAKLAWTVSDGSGSGLATASTFTVRYAMGTATAAPTTALSCTSGGTLLSTGFATSGGVATTNAPTAASITKGGLTTNRYYTFAVCAKDNLGTVSIVQKKTILLK